VTGDEALYHQPRSLTGAKWARSRAAPAGMAGPKAPFPRKVAVVRGKYKYN